MTLEGYDDPADTLSIPIDPRGLILINPAIDLVRRLAGRAEQVPPPSTSIPPRFHLRITSSQGFPPTLVISGSKDGVITPDQIRAFQQRMKHKGNSCHFSEYPKVGHGVFNYGYSGVGAEYFFKAMKEIEGFLAGNARPRE